MDHSNTTYFLLILDPFSVFLYISVICKAQHSGKGVDKTHEMYSQCFFGSESPVLCSM